MYSSSEDSDSDSGTNFKRGKRKVDSPVVQRKNSSPEKKPRTYDGKSRGDDRKIEYSRRNDDSRRRDDDKRRRENELQRRDEEVKRREDQPRRKEEEHRRREEEPRRKEEELRAPKTDNKSIPRREKSRLDSRATDESHIQPRVETERKKFVEGKRDEVIKKRRSRSNEKPHRRITSPVRKESFKVLGKDSHQSNERNFDSRRDIARDCQVVKRFVTSKHHQETHLSESSKRHPRSHSPSKYSTEESHNCRLPSSRKESSSRDSQSKVEENYRSRSKNSNESKKFSRHSSHERSAYGPALPPPASDYGPAKPRHIPDRKARNYERPSIGPTLPKGFQSMDIDQVPIGKYDNLSSDDECVVVGPQLSTSAEHLSERDLEMEKRKIEIKLKQLDQRMQSMTNPDVKEREEWMLELPEIRKVADMGLSARQFRKNDRPDFSDRSDWTNTPNDGSKKSSQKEKAKTEEEMRRELAIRRRDEEQEKMAKEHKKTHKRDKSLLEIHEKKLRKEKVKSPMTD